jgi:ComF family protein
MKHNLSFAYLIARRLATSVDQLLYPPICANCGVFSSHHNALCAQCWKDVKFIEKPYCDVSGHPFAFDLGEGIVSADVIANPPPYKRARAAVVYDGAARKIVHLMKYKDRQELSNLMVNWMVRAARDCLVDADIIVPVPLHRWRLLSRRFNQSAELARNLARKTDKYYLPSALIRKKSTLPQVGLPAIARQNNVRGAFIVQEDKKPDILGKRIILVDDVYTTGATVDAASRALLQAGADEVSVVTFARVVNEH